jgi:phosphoribosyl-ATP pyrophosphohydrolase
MAKSTKKSQGGKVKAKAKATGRKTESKKPARKAVRAVPLDHAAAPVIAAGVPPRPMPPLALGASSSVLDRLWSVVMSRRNASPEISHSARLLARGTAKVAQKFGEEAVECVIEAMQGDPGALIGESADVLYHLIVMWVNASIRPDEVWAELQRREGVSGIAEKASRARKLPVALGIRSTKIP